MIKVIFTPLFKRRLKALAKRYRSIKRDIQPTIVELEKGNFLGDQLSGLSITAFKLRAKNSDIPVGKKRWLPFDLSGVLFRVRFAITNLCKV